MNTRNYIKSLSSSELDELKKELHKQRGGLCYICEEPINLAVHKTDVDHIIAITLNGDDDKHNMAITHAGCNRSKGLRDLQLQQYISRFRKLVGQKIKHGTLGEMITVGDVLEKFGGSKSDVAIENGENEYIKLFYEIDGKAHRKEFNLLNDNQNKDIISYVGMLPKEIIFHDPDINPRSIVNLEPMIEEFYQKRPQLQPSLAYLILNNSGKGKIKLFDGQHKAAAQIINGADNLFVRVFVNPDLDILTKTNFRAHTKLAQIHFPQLISDKVSHSIFEEEFGKYVNTLDSMDKGTEKKFIDSLSPDIKSEFRKYLQGYYKYEVLSSPELKLMKYVETVSARSKTFPLSFESLRRGLLEIFLYLKPAAENLEITQRMRNHEKMNMQTIMNNIADEMLENKFNPNIGIFKIEQRVQDNDPKIKNDHLLAYRMLRQSALIAWSEQFRDALVTYFTSKNKYQSDWHKEKYLWLEIDSDDEKVIRKMIKYIKTHPAWTIKEVNLVNSLSTTKVNEWRTIIKDGKLPGATESYYDPMNSGQILTKAMSMK